MHTIAYEDNSCPMGYYSDMSQNIDGYDECDMVYKNENLNEGLEFSIVDERHPNSGDGWGNGCGAADGNCRFIVEYPIRST